MKISKLGEDKLIESFLDIKKDKNVLLGPGDDCAHIKGMKDILITTDSLSMRTDFPKIMNYTEMGKKSVAVTLSDIAAMGARPRAFLVSLILDKNLDKSDYDKLVLGIKDGCNIHKTPLVGGDVGEGDELIIVGIALGEKVDRILKRSGAKIGDLICTTGYLGAAACGVEYMINIGDSSDSYSLKRAKVPKARIEEGIILSKYANSCIDISDGLAKDLGEIIHQSNLGAEIYEDKIPIHYDTKKIAKKLSKNPLDFVLYGGEDYELLFTINEDNFEKINKISQVKISKIGKIIPKHKLELINKDGNRKEIKKEGFQHFVN